MGGINCSKVLRAKENLLLKEKDIMAEVDQKRIFIRYANDNRNADDAD